MIQAYYKCTDKLGCTLSNAPSLAHSNSTLLFLL